MKIGGREVPLPAIVGAAATFTVWVIAMATHPAARYAGPLWLLIGLVIFVSGAPFARGEGLLEHVESA